MSRVTSLRTDLRDTLHHQGWVVKQVSIIAGVQSLNKQDLRDYLQFFEVPEAGIESDRSWTSRHTTNMQMY